MRVNEWKQTSIFSGSTAKYKFVHVGEERWASGMSYTYTGITGVSETRLRGSFILFCVCGSELLWLLLPHSHANLSARLLCGVILSVPDVSFILPLKQCGVQLSWVVIFRNKKVYTTWKIDYWKMLTVHGYQPHICWILFEPWRLGFRAPLNI